MSLSRVIFHLDMDAFYASVEQRDHPALRGKPVIVGGPPTQRGVVCAASYEARRFGVRSAMPSITAGRLCPQGIFVPVRMSQYKEESKRIMEILERTDAVIERMSIDEAYMDRGSAGVAAVSEGTGEGDFRQEGLRAALVLGGADNAEQIEIVAALEFFVNAGEIAETHFFEYGPDFILLWGGENLVQIDGFAALEGVDQMAADGGARKGAMAGDLVDGLACAKQAERFHHGVAY